MKFSLAFFNPWKSAESYSKPASIRTSVPHILALSSRPWIGIFVTKFSFHSSRCVCLEQTFFSTRHFSSRGKKCCQRRQASGCASHVNIMQRKTLLKILNHLYSIINTGFIDQPQTLTFTTYQLSCISYA